jgi:hypothetical protein
VLNKNPQNSTFNTVYAATESHRKENSQKTKKEENLVELLASGP